MSYISISLSASELAESEEGDFLAEVLNEFADYADGEGPSARFIDECRDALSPAARAFLQRLLDMER